MRKEKSCTKCKIVKLLSEFSVDKRVPDGGSSACKSCQCLWHKEHPRDNRAYSRLYRLTPKSRFSSYKTTARRRNIQFALTFEEFLTFWQKPCSYGGEPITTIGLDRIDNTKGYTLDNVVPCCDIHNSMKGTLSIEIFMEMCIKVAALADCLSKENK